MPSVRSALETLLLVLLSPMAKKGWAYRSQSTGGKVRGGRREVRKRHPPTAVRATSTESKSSAGRPVTSSVATAPAPPTFSQRCPQQTSPKAIWRDHIRNSIRCGRPTQPHTLIRRPLRPSCGLDRGGSPSSPSPSPATSPAARPPP